MGQQDDGEEKRALADCNETVDELKHENAELKEENQELRDASTTFADLAERLSHELRKDNDTEPTIASSDADPKIP
jgi:predicted RNase H-like nuclease (RuvC/YqgF family)